MEKNFGKLEESIFKGFESSPLFQGFSSFLKSMASASKSDASIASEITKGLENTAKLFE